MSQNQEISLCNEEDNNTAHFSTLCLNKPTQSQQQPCSFCGLSPANSSPMKRRFPELSTDSHFTEPRSKRPMFLDPQETSPATFPYVRRNISDPLPPPSPVDCGGCCGSGLPPRPPSSVLRRSISDPILTTPSPAKTLERSSSCSSESPNDKLKMIRHCLKQLCQLCNEAGNEGEIMHFITPQETMNTGVGEKDMNFDTQQVPTSSTMTEDKIEAPQLEPEPESDPKLKTEPQHEESVVVEEIDGKPFVEIKCTCGECYHLLLSEGSCYYEIYHH